jgi:hypothetical protein
MALTLQEISDRMEIQDLLVDYSHAIDTRSWDALDQVFTPDAFIDYTAMGGVEGRLPEIKAWLAKTMPIFSSTQHMVATSKVTIDGDVAEGRTICHNPMIFAGDEEKPNIMMCGLWYRDKFVRTGDGWRIAERIEEKSYIR